MDTISPTAGNLQPGWNPDNDLAVYADNTKLIRAHVQAIVAAESQAISEWRTYCTSSFKGSIAFHLGQRNIAEASIPFGLTTTEVVNQQWVVSNPGQAVIPYKLLYCTGITNQNCTSVNAKHNCTKSLVDENASFRPIQPPLLQSSFLTDLILPHERFRNFWLATDRESLKGRILVWAIFPQSLSPSGQTFVNYASRLIGNEPTDGPQSYALGSPIIPDMPDVDFDLHEATGTNG